MVTRHQMQLNLVVGAAPFFEISPFMIPTTVEQIAQENNLLWNIIVD